MSRAQTFDLLRHGFERVANQCREAMRGESGKFAICVTATGRTTVVRPSYHVTDSIGEFTAWTPPERVESALQRKMHELQEDEPRRRPGRPMEV
jgi:hypothetical protein